MLRKRDVAIIGAGKIGRGFLADCFDDAGFHLVFINGSPRTIDKLNEAKKYTIFTSSPAGVERKIVTDFEAYSSQRDFDTVVKRLTEIDIACVALYPGAYDNVADQLSAAVKARRAAGIEEPINVLFFVNMAFTGRMMREKILSRLADDADKKFFETHMGIIEALTMRGGFNPTPEQLAEDPLCVATTPGKIMPVGDNFIGEKPDIKGMQFLDRMEGRLVKKIWFGNMRHCSQACVGQYRGATYTYEAARDQYVRKHTDYASIEAAYGIGKEYGFTSEEMWDGMKVDWKASQDDSAPDDVCRVAADPLRKLSRNERFIGPALLALKHGKTPFYLARNAAFLLNFKNDNDESCVKMHKIIEEKGIEKAIVEFCGLDLNEKDDRTIYDLILGNYRELLESDVPVEVMKEKF